MIATSSRPDITAAMLADVATDLAGRMELQRLTDVVAPDSDRGRNDAADRCIARFAQAEADVSSDDRAGLGRASNVRFPRLGGVLHARLRPGTPAADLLLVGVEQTVRAGYRAALATDEVADEPVRCTDVHELWPEFLAISYRIPRAVAERTWQVCRFEELWVSVLADLGLPRDARRLSAGRGSPLIRSIRGLSTVGVALAIAERRGRDDRAAVRRRVDARPRGLRALPPMPRAAAATSPR